MKKHIAAIVLIAGLTMATAASANWGRGGYGYGGYGNCPQMQGQMMQQPPDADTQAKVSKFFKDNQSLHKQLAMKQAEKRALMRSDNADPQAVAKVAGELFDLRAAMHDKAEAAGVAQFVGPMGCGMGDGPGFGRGGRRGMGMGNMGNKAPQQQ